MGELILTKREPRGIVFDSETGEAVSVANAYRGDGNLYVCDEGHELIIADGPIMVKHFKHKAGMRHTCCHANEMSNEESLIHKFSKNLIASRLSVGVEVPYPNRRYVADAGSIDKRQFHEVIVTNQYDQSKGRYLRSIAGEFDITAYTMQHIGVETAVMLLNNPDHMWEFMQGRARHIEHIETVVVAPSLSGKSMDGVSLSAHRFSSGSRPIVSDLTTASDKWKTRLESDYARIWGAK